MESFFGPEMLIIHKLFTHTTPSWDNNLLTIMDIKAF